MLDPGRLIITKVLLENFKSYAGIKIIGPFHISFSAVVGPNGSGKSNLLECLLFAFGKRAKKMRLNKISELIHKSHEFPSLSYAKVEVYFQSINDSSEPIENSEFKISRTVYKNNTSVYRINDRDSTYEEVVRLLKSKCIDLEHNRFLILQGEVEQIALMKPKATDENKSGLLEYLEEIIGSDVYISGITQVEKELEDISEQITSKKIQAEQAAKAVEVLREPLKQLQAHLELHKQIFQYSNLKSQILKKKCQDQLQPALEELEKAKNEMKKCELEIINEKKLQSEVVNEFDSRLIELKQLERQETLIRAQINDMIKNDQHLHEDLELSKNKLKTIDEDINSENQRIAGIEKCICDTEFSMPAMVDRFEQIREEREKTDIEFDRANSEILKVTDVIQKNKEELDKDLWPLKQQYNKLKAEIDGNKKNLENVQKEVENNREEREEILKQLEVADEFIMEKGREHEKLEKMLSDIEDTMKRFKVNKIELHTKSDEVEKQINDCKRQLADMENEDKSCEGLSKQYREVMNAKQKGILKGIIGRLGDLGSIASKYDIAMSSASNMFDYIVVDSVSSGEDLIKFIRAKSLGKVNIIVLEKVPNPSTLDFKSPDPKAQRLFDLITFSEKKIEKAFYLALRDTLVTDTLEECRRIAFGLSQRWRVVSITGEVFNQTGEMLGFSRAVCGKVKLIGSAFSVDYKSKEDIISNLKKNSECYEKLSSDIRALEGSIILQQHSISNIQKQMKIIINESDGKRDKVSSLKFRLETLESRAKEFNEKNMSHISELIAKNQNTLDKLEKIIKLKEEEILKIEMLIEAQAGEEFKEIKAKKNYLMQTEEKLEQDIMKNNKKMLQFQKDKEKYTERVIRYEEERKGLTGKIEEIREARKKVESSALEKTKVIEEVFAKVKLKKEELKRFELDREEAKTKYSEISLKLEQSSDWYKELTEIITKLQGSCEKYDEKIETNRQSFKKQNFACLSDLEPNLEHVSKRSNRYEDLLFDVNKDFSIEELQQYESRVSMIQEAETEVAKILSESQADFHILDQYQQRKTEKQLKDTQLLESKLLESEKKSLYLDLKSKRLSEFNNGFFEISKYLRSIYRLITKGGDAELEFADSTDPFAEGIVFTVRPANKSWKKMTNLSGGEKTLSSLALVFALHMYKPNCLYVMDEVDAALDFQNVSVIACYIKARTKNAQFIVVSLRYQMFELADQLVGVYKTQDVSDTITISPYVFVNKVNKNAIVIQTVQNITGH